MELAEFRDEKISLSVKTPVGQILRAVDDGGICYLTLASSGRYHTIDSHMAMIEAKKRFQNIENGQPVITDECLAQMTCEALAARLERRDESDPK